MSDRCHVSVTCLESDQDALTAFLGGADEVSGLPGDDFVELIYYEADGGLTTDREKAAKQGIVFFGSHSAGIEYGPYVFASHIGTMLENEVSIDGNLLIEVSDETVLSRDPDVHLAAFEGVKLYLALHRAAVRIVKGEICTYCGHPDCDLQFGACDEAQAGGF